MVQSLETTHSGTIPPFREFHFNEDDHFDFQILDEDRVTHTIPLHRIRELYKDGELFWHHDNKQGL